MEKYQRILSIISLLKKKYAPKFFKGEKSAVKNDLPPDGNSQKK